MCYLELAWIDGLKHELLIVCPEERLEHLRAADQLLEVPEEGGSLLVGHAGEGQVRVHALEAVADIDSEIPIKL